MALDKRKAEQQSKRSRSDWTERKFAHFRETGGARRCRLIGLFAASNRWLLHVAVRNLGLIMRRLLEIGTPNGMPKGAPTGGAGQRVRLPQVQAGCPASVSTNPAGFRADQVIAPQTKCVWHCH
jgi:hypothetical protein